MGVDSVEMETAMEMETGMATEVSLSVNTHC
jgi:hypothetical protein